MHKPRNHANAQERLGGTGSDVQRLTDLCECPRLLSEQGKEFEVMGDEDGRTCPEAIDNIPQRLAVRPWLTNGYGIVLAHTTLLLVSGYVGA
jgi:hypothetical protein